MNDSVVRLAGCHTDGGPAEYKYEHDELYELFVCHAECCSVVKYTHGGWGIVVLERRDSGFMETDRICLRNNIILEIA